MAVVRRRRRTANAGGAAFVAAVGGAASLEPASVATARLVAAGLRAAAVADAKHAEVAHPDLPLAGATVAILGANPDPELSPSELAPAAAHDHAPHAHDHAADQPKRAVRPHADLLAAFGRHDSTDLHAESNRDAQDHGRPEVPAAKPDAESNARQHLPRATA